MTEEKLKELKKKRDDAYADADDAYQAACDADDAYQAAYAVADIYLKAKKKYKKAKEEMERVMSELILETEFDAHYTEVEGEIYILKEDADKATQRAVDETVRIAKGKIEQLEKQNKEMFTAIKSSCEYDDSWISKKRYESDYYEGDPDLERYKMFKQIIKERGE